RVEDLCDLVWRDRITSANACCFARGPDDEPRASAHRQRPHGSLEVVVVVVASLEAREDRQPHQPPEQDARIEARIFVFLAENHIASLLSLHLDERYRRPRE